jgi:hypothetical protein
MNDTSTNYPLVSITAGHRHGAVSSPQRQGWTCVSPMVDRGVNIRKKEEELRVNAETSTPSSANSHVPSGTLLANRYDGELSSSFTLRHSPVVSSPQYNGLQLARSRGCRAKVPG